MTTEMQEISDDEYRSADGSSLRREHGLTPNGNPMNGRWVLRSGPGGMVDFDRYRNDIAERHGLKLVPNKEHGSMEENRAND